MNPYEVLDVPRNFTLQQLKDNYKRIALKVHPDKGGSEQLFLLVTKCFKKLLQEYHKREADKQYHELKADFTKAAEQHAPVDTSHAYKNNKFDLDKFNRVFSENRIEDVYDKGYKEWITETQTRDGSPPRRNFGKGKNFADAFNSAFENETRVDKSNKYIIKYKEPEALICAKKIAFTELGEENVDDFSGDNMTKKHLNFMDYKVAHTTSKIVDPRILQQRKEYRNIQELEVDRGRIQYDMDETTKSEYEYRQQLEELRERKRQEAMRTRDMLTQQQYERVNQMLLGRRL
jgi:curved DNA-binding protein CbpA